LLNEKIKNNIRYSFYFYLFRILHLFYKNIFPRRNLYFYVTFFKFFRKINACSERKY